MPINFQFSNQSLLRHYVWSCKLRHDWNNAISSTSCWDGIFAKSSRRYTSWQGAHLWNSWNPM